MGVPKTPKDFDYDLWTTESGSYMVRIKATGEVCEVGAETMRFLRAEEKRLRRFLNMGSQTQAADGAVLSLDRFKQEVSDNRLSSCLESQGDLEKIALANIIVERFQADLTPNQLAVYKNCILGGKSYVEYAGECGFSYQYIQKCVAAIRKKAKKFFG